MRNLPLLFILFISHVIIDSEAFQNKISRLNSKFSLNIATEPKSISSSAWTPDAWKKYPIKQPPNYPDQVSFSFYIFVIISVFIISYGFDVIVCHLYWSQVLL
jgi:hypothetical protein